MNVRRKTSDGKTTSEEIVLKAVETYTSEGSLYSPEETDSNSDESLGFQGKGSKTSTPKRIILHGARKERRLQSDEHTEIGIPSATKRSSGRERKDDKNMFNPLLPRKDWGELTTDVTLIFILSKHYFVHIMIHSFG